MASAVDSAVPLAGLLDLQKVFGEPSYYASHPVYSLTAAHRDSKGSSSPSKEKKAVSGNSGDDGAGNDRRRRARHLFGLTSADLVDPSALLKALDLDAAQSKLPEGAAKAKAKGGFVVAPAPPRVLAKKDGDALTLTVPMPGLGKEHVKVWAEKNTVLIQGEGDKTPADGGGDDYAVHYHGRIELPAGAYKMDQVRAEMKNGLLKVTVPKVKKAERKDVVHVTVE